MTKREREKFEDGLIQISPEQKDTGEDLKR
jgi:hypothetical protein